MHTLLTAEQRTRRRLWWALGRWVALTEEQEPGSVSILLWLSLANHCDWGFKNKGQRAVQTFTVATGAGTWRRLEQHGLSNSLAHTLVLWFMSSAGVSNVAIHCSDSSYREYMDSFAQHPSLQHPVTWKESLHWEYIAINPRAKQRWNSHTPNISTACN